MLSGVMTEMAEKEIKDLNQVDPVQRPQRTLKQELLRWKNYKPNLGKVSSIGSHSCKTAFEELQPIQLREMEVPKIHEGRYLICKIIGKPLGLFGVHVLIQDVNGDVEEAVVHNYRYNLADVYWASVGTMFIIKEPCLQYSTKEKNVSIRIDSPTDVIIVDPTDDKLLQQTGAMKWFTLMSEDAEVWREKGNDCFKVGKFDEALMLYDRGIRCNPEMAVLYSNKALTYFKMGAFYYAYEAAKLGLEKGGDREKALYRMGMTAYKMREWQTSVNHFEEFTKKFSKNADAAEKLKLAKARLAEQQHGSFDFKAMFLESKKGKGELDVADYIGPIKIADIPGKGRGIIATKDIPKGTLIAACKAFSAGFSQDIPKELHAAISLAQRDPRNLSQIMLFLKTIENVLGNPQHANEVYDLYHGDESERKEKIPFGIVDADKIEKIYKTNQFGSSNLPKSGGSRSELYLLPSYFNHSCLANAEKTFYGDVLVIHANMDVKKGDELYFAYISPLHEYKSRMKTFTTTWKFACSCQLCETDAKDELCAARNIMFQRFKYFTEEYEDSIPMLLPKGEEILKKIRENYDARDQFKTTLVQMLKLLAEMNHSCGDNKKTIEYFEEVLSLLDDPFKYVFDVPRIQYYLSIAYKENGDFEKGAQMHQEALKSSFCTDMEHFEMLYPPPTASF